MRGYSWKGSYWHPCACASGNCGQFTKARHTWLCWWCEHDRCTEVHLPALAEEDSESQPEQLSCYECGIAVTSACRECGRGCCTQHSPEEGPRQGPPMCLQCFYEVHDSEPLRPVPCICEACGPVGGKCCFSTWSRVPALWSSGRLCFDCNVNYATHTGCACTCGSPTVQRRELALKAVDAALGEPSQKEDSAAGASVSP